jgi:hypothetical protein
MAVIQRHIARDGVFLKVPILARQTGREIGAGNHGLDAIQRQRLGRINLDDPRMGVGRADNSRMQHPRCGNVGPIAGAARHLVQTIGTIGAGANQTVACVHIVFCHHFAPRISAPASITARTILS